MDVILHARPLIDGAAEGGLLLLGAPISFWGGVDPRTGRVTHPGHPDHGRSLSGKIVALPGAIGSSSSSAVMLELLHNGKAPAGLLMASADAILAVGVVVAREMGYGSIPVFVCPVAPLAGRTALRLSPGGIVEG